MVEKDIGIDASMPFAEPNISIESYEDVVVIVGNRLCLRVRVYVAPYERVHSFVRFVQWISAPRQCNFGVHKNRN